MSRKRWMFAPKKRHGGITLSVSIGWSFGTTQGWVYLHDFCCYHKMGASYDGEFFFFNSCLFLADGICVFDSKCFKMVLALGNSEDLSQKNGCLHCCHGIVHEKLSRQDIDISVTAAWLRGPLVDALF